MKTYFSALMDGELEAHETTVTVATLSRDSEQQNLWHLYHVIGDAIRHEPDLTIDVTSQVMTALSLEPTVLSPSRPHRSAIRWQLPVMALAASAAGVAMVAWVALAPVQMPGGSMIASSQTIISPPLPSRTMMAPPDIRAVTPMSSTSSLSTMAEAARLQEYLAAHQAYQGGALIGGTSHIRTVSALGNNR